MRRGDIWTANLDPATGSEANKTRPVIIVSTDALNTVAATLGRGMVTIVPLTSNVSNVRGYELRIPANPITGLQRESKAQTPQIRSIDIARLGEHVGRLPEAMHSDLDHRLRIHLAL
jgi:mRNA interferase MazF